MRQKNAKNRILETASRLFSERGFLSVGINEIIEKSETAKASFYHHFKSKDLLCAAWLHEMHERSEKNHDVILQESGSTEKKLQAYFNQLKEWLNQNDFKGCPYTNTAAVLDSGNPEIRAEIESHKLFIRDFFIELARAVAKGSQARTIGNTWFILYSGATTESQNLRATWPVDTALKAALSSIPKNTLSTLLALVTLVGLLPTTVAAEKAISTTFFGSKAMGGYDAVAYHTAKKAIKGKKSFMTNWKGANWLFTSAKNLRTFQAKPEKFAPQYGGYCAWAAAENKIVKADPTIFDLHNGKLYLNYNAKTQKDWNADRAGMIQRGNKNYPRLIAE